MRRATTAIRLEPVLDLRATQMCRGIEGRLGVVCNILVHSCEAESSETSGIEVGLELQSDGSTMCNRRFERRGQWRPRDYIPAQDEVVLAASRACSKQTDVASAADRCMQLAMTTLDNCEWSYSLRCATTSATRTASPYAETMQCSSRKAQAS